MTGHRTTDADTAGSRPSSRRPRIRITCGTRQLRTSRSSSGGTSDLSNGSPFKACGSFYEILPGCVFRKIVTGRSGNVTAGFGIMTDRSGIVTEGGLEGFEGCV